MEPLVDKASATPLRLLTLSCWGCFAERLVRQCLREDPPVRSLTTRPAPSALLGQLQSFLPQLATANKELAEAMRANPGQYSLDIVDEDDDENDVWDTDDGTSSSGSDEEASDTGPVVVMDLACGVFDLKTPAAVMAAERVSGRWRGEGNSRSEETSEEEESSSASEDESDDGETSQGQGEGLREGLRPTRDGDAGKEGGGKKAGQEGNRTKRKVLISEL
jgi:hypothetical protein